VEYSGASDEELREQAVESLKRKRGFNMQILTWLVVSALLIAIWAATGTDNFFWPVFPIAGWAIGLALQGWSVYGPGSRPISEAEIDRESERLRR
jgi:hypothetical protein